MNRIYFDNASTTQLDPRVQKRMIDVMKNHYGNPSSIHFHGRHARSIIEDARKRIANIVKASIGEIFFTSSATEANNMILKNCVEYLGVTQIISAPTEHHCILHTMDYLKDQKGVEIILLDVDSGGNINLDQLGSILSSSNHKTLVSLMLGNNEIGTMLDLKRVSDICSNHKNVLLHTDSVQAMGKYNIDVNETPIAFLSGTAHKFHGPKGAGFFYMNDDNIIPPFIHGGAQERNMRAGTENVIGIAGMAEALEIAVIEQNLIIAHISEIRERFINRLLTEFEDVRINGNTKELYMHHILSVSFPATPKADMLMFNLDISGISASSGSACSSGIENDSHVLIAIGHESERKTVRFSFSKFNSLEEADQVIEKLKSMTPVKAEFANAG
ncbi:MAG: cysteine desulfurase [Saprospiraceae bacterium]|jgi:cysteine desulfurase